jgi:hypothetical protein
MDMVAMLLDAIAAAGLTRQQAEATLAVQCFDADALAAMSRAMRRRGLELPLVWLLECEDGLPALYAVQRLQELSRVVAVACAASCSGRLLNLACNHKSAQTSPYRTLPAAVPCGIVKVLA